MSVRVHAIAKEVNKTSKELIEILTERGYDIKSASSTIDKITAQSIIDEFTLEASNETGDNTSSNENSVAKKEEDSPKESKKKAPIVRSKAEIEEEKREKEKLPKLRKRVRLSKKDKTYQYSEGNAPTVPPPPVSRATAPPPPSTAGKSGVPSPPQKTLEETTDQSDSNHESGQDMVVEGSLITVKPPIVVRDFATCIGLKPFQLISELMEMGIFASMNQTIDEEVARKIAKLKGLNSKLNIEERKQKLHSPRKKKLLMRMTKSF